VPTDDESDDELAGRAPPLHPDDRLWRHPSELAAFGGGRLGGPPPPPAAGGARGPAWPIALAAGLVGAALCGGVLALTGNLSMDRTTVVEKVAVTPYVSAPMLQNEPGVGALKDKVGPSVVRLLVTGPDGVAHASGVVVRDDGIVVTSAHAVADATSISVVLADGRRLEGALVGADPPTDVAVVSVDADGLTVAWLGTSEDLEVGSTTVAVGSTSAGEPAVATGVVSALGRRLDVGDRSLHGLIQTDAPIEASWAGGPLLDASGAVIGITTDLAGDRSRFGFATPIDLVHRMAGDLIAFGKVSHGWLGIEGADLTDAEAEAMGVSHGAIVRRVMPGSPAADMGLVEGDVITELGDVHVATSSELVVALRHHRPGDEVDVAYWRDGRRHRATVVIESLP
jgi:S1-C subfamily serine protease